MRHLIKKYWDLLGGTIFGITIALLANWKTERLQIVYTVIILCLVCIGLLKSIKENIGSKRKDKAAIDKVLDNQRAIEAVQIAKDPESKGREVYKAILETKKGGTIIMTKIKKLFDLVCKGFKWIWTYRQQVIGLVAAAVVAIVNVYGYILTWIDKAAVQYGSQLSWITTFQSWIVNYADDPVRCILANAVVIIIAVLAVFYLIRNQVAWIGVGSLSTAQAYLEKLAAEAKEDTSEEVRNRLNAIIKKFKPQLKACQKSLSEAKKLVDNTKKALEDAKSTNSLAGIAIENVAPLQVAYDKAMAELAKAQTDFNTTKAVIENCTNKLSINVK